MLDRDDERRLKRLAQTNIAGGLLPSVSLLSDLIKYLNETRTAPGREIVEILEKMLELEEMTKPIKPEEPMIAAVEWERTDPKKYQVHWEIVKRTAILEKQLSNYQFHSSCRSGDGRRGPKSKPMGSMVAKQLTYRTGEKPEDAGKRSAGVDPEADAARRTQSSTALPALSKMAVCEVSAPDILLNKVPAEKLYAER